jgi:hypothetical protein
MEKTNYKGPTCEECGENISMGYAESYGHDSKCSQATLQDQSSEE